MHELWVTKPHRCLCGVRADLICIVLICTQQTVGLHWQPLMLTNTGFSCGEQIVSTLILSNVCLSLTWAAHESFQTQRRCQRWHHAHFSLPMREIVAGCWEGVMTKPTLLMHVYVCQRPFYVFGVWQCVRASSCASACVFMCPVCAQLFDDGAGP